MASHVGLGEAWVHDVGHEGVLASHVGPGEALVPIVGNEEVLASHKGAKPPHVNLGGILTWQVGNWRSLVPNIELQKVLEITMEQRLYLFPLMFALLDVFIGTSLSSLPHDHYCN